MDAPARHPMKGHTMHSSPTMYSAPELARLLGCDVRTLDATVGLPRPVQVGASGRRRYSRAAVEAWLRGVHLDAADLFVIAEGGRAPAQEYGHDIGWQGGGHTALA